MCSLRKLHKNIIDNIAQVQERTGKILQEQEKDLLRAFRARLYSVQEELECEKNKTDDGASAWIDKSKQLETEVEWTKEMADRLDRLNQSLTRENQRLKTQFSMQEADRDFLVKQLVTVKKDNVRLRSEIADKVKECERMKEELAQTTDDDSHKGTDVSAKFFPSNALTSSDPKGKQPTTPFNNTTVNKRGSSAGSFAPSTPEVGRTHSTNLFSMLIIFTSMTYIG
jgi:hypothetical protein